MKKRRFLSLIVAMVMVMSMCLTAMATDNIATLSTGTGDVVTNTETVTITGTSDATSLSLATYQVIYATYVAGSNSLEYHLTEWAKDALVDYSTTEWTPLYASEEAAIKDILAMTGGTSTYGTSTGSGTTEQNTIVNTLAAYVALGSAVTSAGCVTATQYTDSSFTSWDTTSTAGRATAELPVGAYLVLPSANNMSFLNMLVSVDATEGSTANTWKTTGNGAVLKGKPNGITKLVSEGGSTAAASADAQIGETVTYTVTVDVPQFATNIDNDDITFQVVDTPQNVLIDETSVVVTPIKTSDGSKDTTLTAGVGYDYTATKSGDVLTVDLSINYQNVFCDSGNYPYKQVEITYTATVLSSAKVDTANNNEAVLSYGIDTDINTASDDADVYTYELDLTKTDGSNGLAGAKFQILGSTGNAISFVYDTDESGVYTVYDEPDSTKVTIDTDPTLSIETTLTVDSNGKIVIKGLDSDTEYYIHETTAPAGYSLNSNYLRFKITATTPGTIDVSGVATQVYTAAPGTTQTKTDDTAWTASKSADNNYTVTAGLTDTEIPAMPSTGSIGIIIFTVLGVCLMIVAVFLMTSSKDSKKKQAQ